MTLAELLAKTPEASLPADWQSQLGDTLTHLLAAIKASALNSDLQDPEVTAALTAAFSQLVEASLVERKLNKPSAPVTPIKATG